jgi:phage terminase large subunit
MDINFPEALQCLFTPSRYKVLYGGRGGAKSWGIARALLLFGKMTDQQFKDAGLLFKSPLRIICAREIMDSLADSVQALLEDQITALGLDWFYTCTGSYIRGKNGTEFSFKGLKNNISKIKSFEAADILWIEEARDTTKHTLSVIIPTIRRENSELWFSFNPELEQDEVYKRFVLGRPKNAIVQKVNYYDNPWFPEVMRLEMEELKSSDYDEYLHVYEGFPRVSLDGAVYAKEIRAAMESGRITRVPYDAGHPVYLFFDLGRADKTSIWFIQMIGYEFRCIDFYESQGFAFTHYLKIVKEKPYVYGIMWLPHDAENESVAAEKTVARQASDAGFTVKIVPKTSSVASDIEQVRNIFNRVVFDEEKCSDGINCLRNYRFKIDPNTKQYSKEPLHDWASHAADAFRYFATHFKPIKDTSRRRLTADTDYAIYG